MDRKDTAMILFAMGVLFTIPAVLHASFQAVRAINATALAAHFWIRYSVSITLPYVLLAVLFLAHCYLLRSRSRKSAYCGAIMAWLAMMTFSIVLILHAPTRITPTMAALTVVLTPFCYVPYLCAPYVAGSLVGMYWSKWTDGKPHLQS